MSVGWVIPTAIYMVCLGAFGITGKLALRTLEWPDLILWTGVGYVITAGSLLLLGRTEFRVVQGTGWAIATAFLAIAALVTVYLALGSGEVTKVISISAGYPVVTLILASVVLSEPASVLRLAGAGLVIVGVAVMGVAR